jgi:hypothetical protein
MPGDGLYILVRRSAAAADLMTPKEYNSMHRIRRVALGALVALALLGAGAAFYPPGPTVTDYPPGPYKAAGVIIHDSPAA